MTRSSSLRKRSLILSSSLMLVFQLLSAGLLWAAEKERPKDLGQERELIRETVEDLYVGGLKTRDFSLIEAICIPEAKLMSAGRDGVLRITSLEKWSGRFDPAKPPPFQHLDHSITKIDVVGTAAQVKIQFIIDHERPVTDFLHMLKIDGKWRISHIIDY